MTLLVILVDCTIETMTTIKKRKIPSNTPLPEQSSDSIQSGRLDDSDESEAEQEKRSENLGGARRNLKGASGILSLSKAFDKYPSCRAPFVAYAKQWWDAFINSHTVTLAAEPVPCLLCGQGHITQLPCQIYRAKVFTTKFGGAKKMPLSGVTAMPTSKGKKLSYPPGYINRRVSDSKGRAQVDVLGLVGDGLPSSSAGVYTGADTLALLASFTESTGNRPKVMAYHVPWLWEYTTADLERATQLTGSHSCHVNSTATGACQVHVTPAGLDEQKGYNHCAPCVCFMHTPRCVVAGKSFLALMGRSDPDSVRARLSECAAALPVTANSTTQSSHGSDVAE